MANKNNSTHIRAYEEDKKKWRDYCKGLGVASPELFHKVINSPNVNLNERISNELKRQQQELEKRLGIKRNGR